jgi:hypothetical protein
VSMAGASAGFLECLSCITEFLTKDEESVKLIADEVVKIIERVRCVDTYTTLLWFTFEVSISYLIKCSLAKYIDMYIQISMSTWCTSCITGVLVLILLIYKSNLYSTSKNIVLKISRCKTSNCT